MDVRLRESEDQTEFFELFFDTEESEVVGVDDGKLLGSVFKGEGKNIDFWTSDIFREIGIGAEDKIALLYNPSMEKKFKFFQNVAKFALLNFRLFDNKEDALAWLKSEE